MESSLESFKSQISPKIYKNSYDIILILKDEIIDESFELYVGTGSGPNLDYNTKIYVFKDKQLFLNYLYNLLNK